MTIEDELRAQVRGLEQLVHHYESKCHCAEEHAELEALRTEVAGLRSANADLIRTVKDMAELMRSMQE